MWRLGVRPVPGASPAPGAACVPGRDPRWRAYSGQARGSSGLAWCRSTSVWPRTPRAWRPVVLSQQQSPRKDPDSEREVFRGPGSAILSWAWFVVALIILVDLAVQG